MNFLPAGIVLVGGQSSRMGRNKALLEYKGAPLFRHMQSLLVSVGLNDVFFSGELPGADNCLIEPHAHQGPARALAYVARHLEGKFTHMLVVPVDMPLLTPAILQRLLTEQTPCYFENNPLPALLKVEAVPEVVHSMHALLKHQGAQQLSITAADSATLRNFNTPEEWATLA